MTAHLREHPAATIFISLPRWGQINSAQNLAGGGDSHEAHDSLDAAAALVGLTSVTKASGKYHAVHFRRARNKRFRKPMTTFADNSSHESLWAADVYRRAIKRGHDRPHAVRVLARACVPVIDHCWINQEPYDPARHGTAIKINTGQTAVCG